MDPLRDAPPWLGMDGGTCAGLRFQALFGGLVFGLAISVSDHVGKIGTAQDSLQP